VHPPPLSFLMHFSRSKLDPFPFLGVQAIPPFEVIFCHPLPLPRFLSSPLFLSTISTARVPLLFLFLVFRIWSTAHQCTSYLNPLYLVPPPPSRQALDFDLFFPLIYWFFPFAVPLASSFRLPLSPVPRRRSRFPPPLFVFPFSRRGCDSPTFPRVRPKCVFPLRPSSSFWVFTLALSPFFFSPPWPRSASPPPALDSVFDDVPHVFFASYLHDPRLLEILSFPGMASPVPSHTNTVIDLA